MPITYEPEGAEFRVSTYTTSEQYYSSIAGLAGGGYVITWMSYGQDGSAQGIYAQRYDSSGVAVGTETLVNTTTAGDQGEPSVAALAGGGYVITWFSPDPGFAGFGIYAQRYDSSGVAQGAEVHVSTATASDQRDPSVAALADGGYVVAWMSFGQDGDGFGVYAQRYNASGVAQGGEVRVSTTTTSNQMFPTVAALEGGGYVITWMSYLQDGDAWGVYAQRYNASGVAQGAEVRINTTTTSDQSYPTIAALDGGGYVITWMSYNQDGSGYGIYAQRYNGSGVAQGTEFRVNTTTLGEQAFQAVTALEAGGFVVTWQSPDGSNEGIYAQHYDAAGVAQGAEFLINSTTSNDQSYPSIAGLAGGGYVISWQSNLQDSSGYGVYAQLFAAIIVNEEPAGGDGTVAVDGASYTFTPADFNFSDSDGNAFLYVIFTTVPTLGVLRYDNGSASFDLTAGQVMPVAEINAGHLSYIPPEGASGIGPTFTFQVIDNGGTESGGQDTDQSPNTMTLDIAAANEAPVVTITPQNYRPAGNETLVNTTTSNTQIAASTAALADGSYVVTWTSYLQDGSGSGVYMQRYDSLGVALGAETRVNTTITGDQSSSSVTALAGGGYVVTWVSGQTGNNGIYAQRFDSSGTALGGETVVDTNTAYAQISTAIAALPSGGYVIAWTSYLQDGSSYGVYMQRYDASGVPLGVETRINTTTTDDQSDPSVTGLVGGGFVVTWMSYSQDGSVGGVYMQRYDASGVAQGIETRVNTTTTGHQSDPSVTGLADGSYVVTWTSYLQDGSSYGVYMQRYDASGVALGSETLVNSTTSGIQDSASVASLEAGGFVVTWSSYAQDGSGYGVYGQVYGSSGVAVGGEFLINTTTANNQENQSVTGLADGGYLVTWFGLDASSYGIYSQRFEPIYSAAEGSLLSLKGSMSVADVDAGSATVTATLSVDYGYLNVTAGTSGALVGGNGTSTVTITGTMAQINALLGSNATSTVQYVADGNAPPTSAQLTLSVDDGGNTGSGGAQIGSASETIVITPVNDAPAGADDTVIVTENGSYAFTSADFGFNDTDGNALVGVVVTTLPAAGSLTLSGAAVTAGDFITAADIAAGLLAFTPAADVFGDGYATFTFQVRDDGGTANGGQNTDQTPNTITIDVARESIDGTASGDVITGTSEPDLIHGLGGNDDIDGLGGNDEIYGGAGNDIIDGRGGADAMYGGIGNDLFYVDNAGDLVIEYSGEGYDTVISTISHALAGNVEKLYLIGTAAIDGTGNALANTIYGNSGVNMLNGGDGEDRLKGKGGDDQLFGGGGNDNLNGEGGADQMSGGLGNDIYYVNDAGDLVIELGGEGYDTVNSYVSHTLADNVEKLNLIGNLATNGTGNDLVNTLTGNNAANRLEGGAGNDILRGNGGADVLAGGTGKDSLNGGAGADIFEFATGDASGDRIYDFSQAQGDKVSLILFDADSATGGHQAFSFVGSAAFSGTAGELRYVQVDGLTVIYGDTDGDGDADFAISMTGTINLTSGDFVI